MKRLCLQLTAFLFVPALVLCVYPSDRNPYVVNRRAYVEEVDEFARRSGVEAVLLGDSHVESVRRQLLGARTYNLASGGDGLTEMLVKAVYALHRDPMLRLAIVSCDYHMCARHKVRSPKRSFVFPFIEPELRGEVYGGMDEVTRRLVTLNPIFDGQFYTFERERLKAELRGLLASRPAEAGGGATPIWADLPSDLRAFQARRAGTQDYAGILEDPQSASLYARIVDRLRRAGVRVIGVRFPVDPLYLEQIPVAQRRRVESFQASLGFERILDYKELTADPHHFADGDHVSAEGARLLLERLRNDVDAAL